MDGGLVWAPLIEGCLSADLALLTSPIKAMPLVFKMIKNSIFRTKAARGDKIEI
jgi:hypothetical protein